MEYFKIENGIVKPSPEILLVYPFSEIWLRDKSKKKSQAILEFSYIVFLKSHKRENPFSGYDENIRESKIIESIFKKEFIPDDLVLEACKMIDEFEENASPSLRFYKANTKALNTLTEFLQEVDLDERDERGKLIHNPNNIQRILDNAPKTLSGHQELKKKIQQELFESSKTRANKSINSLER